MQTLYFFLLIFCGIYGAVKLMSLFYCRLVDKISGVTKRIHTDNPVKSMRGKV